ncbi:Crp/Fnr family transcriptional regulator [Sphingomonas oryzagri]
MHPLLIKLQTLQDFGQEDRTLIESLTHDVRRIPAGSDIISEGARPEYAHVMIEGWSCRYQLLPDGGRQITAFLVPGDLCDAHVAILDRMDHSIGALTTSRVAFIPRIGMERLFERPAIAKALWWASLVDAAILRAWVVNLGRRDAFDRVAHLVCEMHARLSNVGMAGGGTFVLPLTRADLGDALGLTPVHIGRVLRLLRDQCIMTFEQKNIVITDVAQLMHAGDFRIDYLHLLDRRKKP